MLISLLKKSNTKYKFIIQKPLSVAYHAIQLTNLFEFSVSAFTPVSCARSIIKIITVQWECATNRLTDMELVPRPRKSLLHRRISSMTGKIVKIKDLFKTQSSNLWTLSWSSEDFLQSSTNKK